MNIDRCIGKSVTILFSLTVVLALSTSALRAQTGEQKAYQAARQQNTIEAWEAYLKKYPTGENAKAARESHDTLLLQETEKSADNPTTLETLFKRCKTLSGSDKVFRLWDDALWAASKNTDTPEAYRGYLLRFPGGQHVKEANAAIEEATWRRCQELGKVEFYEAYLKQYPNGTHAKEAREAISDRAYQAAREKDTIEAYESFLKDHYGHKAAEKRLRQLRYERAVKTGTLEHWKAFHDKYRYSRWDDDGKDVEQMKDNANKEIERLLYETIVAQPTLEACRDYLNRYRDGIHKQQVMVRMEPCLFDEAVRTNKVETYFDYLEDYPEGYRDPDIKKRLDILIFRTLNQKENFSSFERYLRLSPKTKDVLLARMEPFMFEWAKRVNTVESYDNYLSRYPDGAHLKEVQTSMDPLLFKKAQTEDWYSSYENYVKKCPSGANVQKAQERVAWLKSQKAVVKVDYPETVERNGIRWDFTAKFEETGGKIGYRVTEGTRYWYTPKGTWYSGGGVVLTVKPGGSASDDTWWRSADHDLCNSSREVTWTGEDAGGHPIEVKVKVKSSHVGCTGK